jgi:hypothetical protein
MPAPRSPVSIYMTVILNDDVFPLCNLVRFHFLP